MVAGANVGRGRTYTQDLDGSFYERERERLMADITSVCIRMTYPQSLEVIIANSNAVNRKLEEQISVGKGFDSISALWGQFSELMVQAGMPPTHAADMETDTDTSVVGQRDTYEPTTQADERT